jgi:spore protease
MGGIGRSKKKNGEKTGRGREVFARTDLACEAGREIARKSERRVEVGGVPVTVTRSREADGGRYVTVACGRIGERGEEDLPALTELLSEELVAMATVMLGHKPSPDDRILVVGLGNADMTPDAVGPGTVRRMTVTRHLRGYDEALFASLGCCELSALSPGVMGQTGMESAELVRGAAELIRPDLIVAVDALAARSCERLAATVQLSDGGIGPGAGIGNHRMAIDRDSVGCPVMALGVPTVVDSSTVVWDALAEAGVDTEALPDRLGEVLEQGRSFIVAPRDADRMVEMICMWFARALDRAFGIEKT